MNKNFQYYLNKTKEVGYVEEVFPSLVYASGLPSVHASELVIFESGEMGQVWSVTENYLEILLLTSSNLKGGTKITRTGKILQIPVGDFVLGKHLEPIYITSNKGIEYRPIDSAPFGIVHRDLVNEPFETGVSMVDLVVPLGRGQRELVIGDRKTGKSTFSLQTLLSFYSAGGITIYTLIGKTRQEIKRLSDFLKENNVMDRCVLISSSLINPPALSFMAPMTAMTIAEYFKDQGKDVLVIFDDLTTHAKIYREIALLARRFPGRNSYPGDIFYIHSKLLERAGKYKKGTITAIAIADSVLSDLSGYIQTNLMAITDGHIFFDFDYFNQGKRPPINPYLSVTRVGAQAQTELARDASRTLARFLIRYKRLTELAHFGADFKERAAEDLALGEQVQAFFNQRSLVIVPMSLSILIFASIWGRLWKGARISDFRKRLDELIELYYKDSTYKEKVNGVINKHNAFTDLVTEVRANSDLYI